MTWCRLEEKEAEISKLKAELETKLNETTKLNADLEAQKTKNNVSPHLRSRTYTHAMAK